MPEYSGRKDSGNPKPGDTDKFLHTVCAMSIEYFNKNTVSQDRQMRIMKMILCGGDSKVLKYYDLSYV